MLRERKKCVDREIKIKMADKQKRLSIEEEEILAIGVKKYPCLFDKTDRGYKEKDCVINAWEEVAKELEFTENGLFFYCFHFPKIILNRINIINIIYLS